MAAKKRLSSRRRTYKSEAHGSLATTTKTDQGEDATMNSIFRNRWGKSLLLFLILAAVILKIETVASWVSQLSSSTSAGDNVDDVELESHQRMSLFNKYTVDYSSMMRTRMENMKKYDFDYDVFGVDKRSDLSLQEYRDVYDGKWPVVITDVVNKWAVSNWTHEFFKTTYASHNAITKVTQGGLYNSIKKALPVDYFYQNRLDANPYSWLYIEDEFFITQRFELYSGIGENIYMKEDFFKLFPHTLQPWDAMLLWGTPYSRSTLHMDPYNWTGTNAVISGVKRWKLYPPGQDSYLHATKEPSSGFPMDCHHYMSKIDAFDPNWELFPEFHKAKAVEFDQLSGELLLIPTGWFHQAYNVEETIAISSEMMNRNNFRIVLEEILKVLSNVKRSELPPNIDSLSPPEQVRVVMSMLPQHIIDRGDAVTQQVLSMIEQGI